MGGECPVPSHWQEKLPLRDAGTTGERTGQQGLSSQGKGPGFSWAPIPSKYHQGALAAVLAPAGDLLLRRAISIPSHPWGSLME